MHIKGDRIEEYTLKTGMVCSKAIKCKLMKGLEISVILSFKQLDEGCVYDKYHFVFLSITCGQTQFIALLATSKASENMKQNAPFHEPFPPV